jgi:4-phosphopantoate---beta-alanine ligase
MKIPRSHPRHDSLVRRETLVKAWRSGVAVPEGLIAHGRGEAWDYLFGEATSAPALVAEKAAAAFLLHAKHPVISVNGNTAALASADAVHLAKAVSAQIEVNLFHRTEARVNRIARALRRAGAEKVLGSRPDARIPGLESKRALVHRAGIYLSDVVIVPLEDGDRTEALVRMGKTVISIDLNPLSRTSQMASVPIVDDVSRGLRNVQKFVNELREDPAEQSRIMKSYDADRNLRAVFGFLRWRLRNLETPRRSRRR